MEMKSIFCICMCVFLSVGSVLAKDGEFVAPVPKKQPVEEQPTQVTPKLKSFKGILAQIFLIARPLQQINPFAPAYYGTGEQNVSTQKGFGDSYPNPPSLIFLGISPE